MKLLLVDLDGTCRTTISGSVCPNTPKDQVLLPKVAALLRDYKADSWEIVGISNQGGCDAVNPTTEKPYKNRRQTIAEMRYFLKLAPEVDRVYFCPNIDDRGDEVFVVKRPWWAPSWVRVDHEWNNDHPRYHKYATGFRKPSPGMIQLAIDEYTEKACHRMFEGFDAKYDRSETIESALKETPLISLMVGDKDSDRDAATAAGIAYIDHLDWWDPQKVSVHEAGNIAAAAALISTVK